MLTVRPYERRDLAGMAELVNARVDAEGEGERVTEASLAEAYDHLRNCDPVTDIVVAERDGAVAGYARSFWHDVAEGQRAFFCAFEGRDAGVAQSMFDRACARSTAIAAGHEHPNKRLETWATAGTARDEMVRAAGFEVHGWSVLMCRRLDGAIADRPLAAGLEVRRPVDADQFRVIWESDVAAFRDHAGFVEPTEEDFAGFVAEAAQGTGLWHVAWDGDVVVGQVRTFVREGESEAIGRRRAWTENISTCREWRGRGVASALITASLRELAELGFDEAALTVDLDNPNGALGIYSALGYVEVARQHHYHRDV